MDGSDGYTIMWMYLMPLNCTLKRVKMINCMLCVFYNQKVKKGTWKVPAMYILILRKGIKREETE